MTNLDSQLEVCCGFEKVGFEPKSGSCYGANECPLELMKSRRRSFFERQTADVQSDPSWKNV